MKRANVAVALIAFGGALIGNGLVQFFFHAWWVAALIVAVGALFWLVGWFL